MIFRSPHLAINVPEVSITDFVFGRVQAFKDRTALIDAGTGTRVSFRELYDDIVATARGLSRAGFQQGDVFAIFSPNCIDYVIAFHAVAMLGGIITTANPLNTSEELSRQLKDCNARYAMTVPSLMEKVMISVPDTGVQEVFLAGDGDAKNRSLKSLRETEGPLPKVSIRPREDVVALPYSSGTTGFPKGVMLTHYNLVANLLQIESSRIYDADEVVVCVLPLYHIYGMVVIMNACLYLGHTNVMLQRFDLEQFLAAIRTYGVTIAPLVPPIVLAITKRPGSLEELSSLRTIFSAAAPLGAELTRECRSRIGCVIKQGYGMTEASPATHMSIADPDRIEDGTVGVCVANTECKIVDDHGNELGLNQAGQILVRGPQVMKGYLNRSEETGRCIDRDGWLRTGDIGFADEKGNFTIVDRVKELIKYKGYQVAPAEIEAVLLTHPMVADAAVIPASDPEAGEVPKAFVVLKGPIDLEEIQSYVAERVAAYKKIRKIESIDQIPKSPSGKILRRILVQRERAR